MSDAGPLEQRLFRLSISLKLLFWVAVLTMLVIGIWDVASGRRIGPPMALVLSLPALALAQLCVWFAWWRIRRARLKEAGS